MYDEEQDEKEPLDPFVLEILLQIFRKVFNVNHFFSKEELQLTPEHFIEKIMNNEMKDITKEDVESYIKQGATIIDVRSPQEYREGHVDGAICIPDYQIKREIEKKVSNKDELIVVYCATGHRSQRTQQILEDMGYTNVYNVYEGIII